MPKRNLFYLFTYLFSHERTYLHTNKQTNKQTGSEKNIDSTNTVQNKRKKKQKRKETTKRGININKISPMNKQTNGVCCNAPFVKQRAVAKNATIIFNQTSLQLCREITILIIIKSDLALLRASISVSFFAKRVAMSCARNVPCDSMAGDESSRTNDNVTLLHRRDHNFDMLSE